MKRRRWSGRQKGCGDYLKADRGGVDRWFVDEDRRSAPPSMFRRNIVPCASDGGAETDGGGGNVAAAQGATFL